MQQIGRILVHTTGLTNNPLIIAFEVVVVYLRLDLLDGLSFLPRRRWCQIILCCAWCVCFEVQHFVHEIRIFLEFTFYHFIELIFDYYDVAYLYDLGVGVEKSKEM